VGHADVTLREDKDVIPEAGFEVVFHLWEVEVGSQTALDEFVRVVVEVEGKVEERSRHGLVIDCYARFVKVPSSWPEKQR